MAASDYVAAVPQAIGPWVGPDYTVLGTDGFGRSETRADLRRFFEVDAEHIAVAVLSALARGGKIDPGVVRGAMAEFQIDSERVNPAYL